MIAVFLSLLTFTVWMWHFARMQQYKLRLNSNKLFNEIDKQGFKAVDEPKNKFPIVIRINDSIEKIGSMFVTVISRAIGIQFNLGNRGVGTVLIISALIGLRSPLLGCVVASVGVGLLFQQASKRTGSSSALYDREVPFAVDVMRIAVEAGCNTLQALEFVVEVGDGDASHRRVFDDITRTLQEIRLGKPVDVALTDMGSVRGGNMLLLGSTISSAYRLGTPLAQSLERLSYEVRHEQARVAEQNAKKLSVKLMFPLAGLILPAFALLTVVPILAGSIANLATSFN